MSNALLNHICWCCTTLISITVPIVYVFVYVFVFIFILMLVLQVALLRIGRTEGESKGGEEGAGVLSDEEVAMALHTPLPSEMMLKGAVAAEVLQMEQKLEDALEHRLQLSLKSQVHDVGTGLNRSVHRQLQQMCADMGIEYYPTDYDAASSVAGTTAAAGYGGGSGGGDEGDAGRRARIEYRTRLLEARRL